MKLIHSKIKPNVLLGIIHKFSDIPNGRVDIAPDEEFLQVSSMRLNKRGFKPHKHIWKDGEDKVIAQESWVCVKGSVKVTMFDFDDKIIDESILNNGDISVTFQGGHTYDILEDDTIVYEYKTGPYKGQQNDKVFI
jgi:hypothetical protein|tara:strand:+ start:350 stop:757 length:408 start_codon:yes stop_codon:yes gene_type:complete